MRRTAEILISGVQTNRTDACCVCVLLKALFASFCFASAFVSENFQRRYTQSSVDNTMSPLALGLVTLAFVCRVVNGVARAQSLTMS